MMDTRNRRGNHPVEVLSPSRITDYYCSNKKETNGSVLNNLKVSCDKKSSVYLTPDSSPLKGSQDDVVNVPSVPDEKSMQTNGLAKDGEPTRTVDSVETVESSLQKLCKRDPLDSSDDVTKLNGSMKEQESVGAEPDSTKRKSAQHRICRVASTNGEKDTSSSEALSVETTTTSSPSLPPSKVRKDSKPELGKNEIKGKAVAPTAGSKAKSGRKQKAAPVQSTTITDYFPIRRSGRQTKSQIEKETQLHIEQLILSKCEDGLEVKEFGGKGRGIVATKMFDKGDFVVEYAGDLLDLGTAQEREWKYAETPSIGCYMYFFSHRDNQYCVDATVESGSLGRLINHSRNGNCGTKVVMVDGKPRLILVAAKHILKGEELSYDYGDRSKSSLEAHPWLKL